jgi:hypothetical protein
MPVYSKLRALASFSLSMYIVTLARSYLVRRRRLVPILCLALLLCFVRAVSALIVSAVLAPSFHRYLSIIL